MKSINFDEGYKKYAINDDESRVVKIKIGDFNLLERLKSAMAEIEPLKEKFSSNPDENTMIEVDSCIRQLIDKAFDSDVCAAVFGNSNVCTVVSGGKLLFEAFFEAFMPLLEADIKATVMTKKVNKPEIRPEVQKYIDAPKITPIAGLAEPYKNDFLDISQLTPEDKRALIAQLIT